MSFGTTRSRRKLSALATAAIAVAINQGSIHAETATWEGTTNSSWATSTNWSPSTAPGQDGTTTNGDTALFNNSGNGQTTVTVDSSRNVQNIIFDAGSAAYTLTGSSLILTPTGEIEMTSADTSAQHLSDGLQFSEDGEFYSVLNNSTTSTASMTISGFSALGNGSINYPTSTLFIGGSNTGANTVTGSFSDSVLNQMVVDKTGTGTWIASGGDINSNANAYSGTLELTGGFICGGTLSVNTSATLLLLGNGNVSPAAGFDIDAGGTLTLNDSQTSKSNRIFGMSLNGGTFNEISGSASVYDCNGGTLAIGAGSSAVVLDTNTVGFTEFLPQVMTRTTGGTLLIQGNNLGATPGANVATVEVASAGTGVAQAGGGGGTGSTEISILPFVVSQNTAQTGNAQFGFVTGIGQANGLRPLNLSLEYTNTISDFTDLGNALHDVSLASAATVNAATTKINALRLDTGGSVGGSGTLTINSGAVLALNGNLGINVANLSTGADEAIFATEGNLSLDTNLTCGGLTKTGPGELYLNPSTTLNYAGQTNIGQGTLQLGSSNQLPSNTDLILTGGNLDLNGQNLSVANLFAGTGTRSDPSGDLATIVNSNSNPQVTLTLNFNPYNLVGLSGGGSTFSGTIGAPGANNLGLTLDSLQKLASLTLQNANTFTGPTTVKSGELNLDFSRLNSSSSNIISPSSNLQLGSPLVMTIGPDTIASQTFNNTSLLPGPAAISVSQSADALGLVSINSAMNVYLGEITRSVGTSVNLQGLQGKFGFFTSNVNVHNMIGGYVTMNGTDWVFSTQSILNPDIPAIYSNDTWSPNFNVTVTTNSTQAANSEANSLRFGLAASDTVTLSGTNILQSGGILISSAVGATQDRIVGGTLEGAAGADLIVNQWDSTTNGTFEIDSTIADNTSSTALTKAGTGTLILGGANTYSGQTYVDNGILSISSNANLGSPTAGAGINIEGGTLAITGVSISLDNSGANARPIQVGDSGGSIDIASGLTLTSRGPVTGQGELLLTDAGTLNLAGANSYTGELAEEDGLLELSNSNALADATLAILDPSVSDCVTFAPGIGTFIVGSLIGNNNVTLTDAASNPVTLDIGNNNQSGSYRGLLSGGGGVTKIGTGTFTLASSVTSYSGVTQIIDGTLVIAHIPTGGAVVNNSTLVVSGAATAGNVIGSGQTQINSGVTLTATGFQQSGGVVDNGTLQINGAGTIGGGAIPAITGAGALSIGTGTSNNEVQLAPNSGASQVSALNIATGASLDLANNHLLIDYGSNQDPIATIAGYLKSGYNGGSWNGPGIDSSAAAANSLSYSLGYADSADPGNPANLSSGTIEIKYTLLGDANLDGVVNGIDFGILAANFNKGVTGWDKGDFNYDNVVNGIDFGELAANFNKGASGASFGPGPLSDPALVAFAQANGLMANIPEPATIGLAAITGFGLLVRRRRSSRQ